MRAVVSLTVLTGHQLPARMRSSDATGRCRPLLEGAHGCNDDAASASVEA
jgi:hypothetical protein